MLGCIICGVVGIIVGGFSVVGYQIFTAKDEEKQLKDLLNAAKKAAGLKKGEIKIAAKKIIDKL